MRNPSSGRKGLLLLPLMAALAFLLPLLLVQSPAVQQVATLLIILIVLVLLCGLTWVVVNSGAKKSTTAVGLPRYRWITLSGVTALVGLVAWLGVVVTQELPTDPALQFATYVLILLGFLGVIVWFVAKIFMIVRTLLERTQTR